jgi:hypothetical protein
MVHIKLSGILISTGVTITIKYEITLDQTNRTMNLDVVFLSKLNIKPHSSKIVRIYNCLKIVKILEN